MSGLDDWLAVARDASADDLRERILTGFKAGKPFTPYRPTIGLPVPLGRVLDFGCGVGRNFPFLRQQAAQITGFDLPPMIARCRELAPVPADALWSNWNTLRGQRFDLVFATLVLQHVEPEACAAYVRDFARMAPAIYLLSRASSDFATSVFQTCAETAAFEAGPCVEVEHDAATHQLKVLGTRTVDEVLARGPHDSHYEVVLRSRVFTAGTEVEEN